MQIYKTEIKAYDNTVVFHNVRAATEFEAELKLKSEAYALTRTDHMVRFITVTAGVAALWAREFEGRLLARLEEELSSQKAQPSAAAQTPKKSA